MSCLVELQAKYGQLSREFTHNMAIQSAFAHVFNTSGLTLTDLQAVLAQYAAGKTYLTKHQLWPVPASQGKSRISHATALFLLMTGAVAHVHMVFPSDRLM
jgi:hypothetical protein